MLTNSAAFWNVIPHTDWHHNYILEGLAQVDCAQVGLEHTCGQLYVDGCAYMCASTCVCPVEIQSSVHRNLISCSITALSPMLLSSHILPPCLFHGAFILARNKLACLVNCCYVSSFYCIMRDYQKKWWESRVSL